MSRDYQVNEGKADVDKLMLTYFNFINGKYLKKALESFAQREGYGQELVFVFFQSDLENTLNQKQFSNDNSKEMLYLPLAI